MITMDLMRRFAAPMPDATLRKHVDALEAARSVSTVQTPRRLAHILGQLYVETAGFTALVESLRYKTPSVLDATFSAVNGEEDARALIARGEQAIANRVYGNRFGNGGEASGDGWTFRGSGYIHLTFRSNYALFARKTGVDLIGNPELARNPVTAAKIAFQFWDMQGCSPLADAGDVGAITECINGTALAGLKERRDAVGRAVKLWGG